MKSQKEKGIDLVCKPAGPLKGLHLASGHVFSPPAVVIVYVKEADVLASSLPSDLSFAL